MLRLTRFLFLVLAFCALILRAIGATSSDGQSVRTLARTENTVSASAVGLRDESHGNSSRAQWSNTTSTTPETSRGSLDCWNQWTEYWDASQSLGDPYQSSWTTSTSVHTYNSASTAYRTTTGSWTETFGTGTQTEVVYQDPVHGNFPLATSTYTTTLIAVGDGQKLVPLSTGSTTVVRQTTLLSWAVVANASSVTSPACSLPALVPQCQLEWEEYIAGGALGPRKPQCTEASVSSRGCSTLISAAFAQVPVFGNQAIDVWVTDGSTTSWPTTKSYGPGCSLGCQQCAVTGNTVKVYYWPETATALPGRNTTLWPSTSTRSVPARPIVAIVDNTTLTSPTVYISYATLSASDSCSGVGQTIKHTIVPLRNSQDLSSLAYQPIDGNIGFRPGNWVGGSWKYATKPFNYKDLVEPIPNSVYNQMPACQVQSHAFNTAGIPGNFTCSPRVAYAPLIALPSDVFALDPAWASCTAWYGGLFDPPVALQGAAAVATLTTPVAVQTKPASAGSTLSAGLPFETGWTYQPISSRTADPTMIIASTSTSLPTSSTASDGSQIVGPAPSTGTIDRGSEPANIQPSILASVAEGSAEQSASTTTLADPPESGAAGAAGIIASLIGATRSISISPSDSQVADPASESQTTTIAPSVPSAAVATGSTASKVPAVTLTLSNLQLTSDDFKLSGLIPALISLPTTTPLTTRLYSITQSDSAVQSTPAAAGEQVSAPAGLQSISAGPGNSLAAAATGPNPTPQTSVSRASAGLVFEVDSQIYTAYKPTSDIDGVEIADPTTTLSLAPGGYTRLGAQSISVIGDGSLAVGQNTLAFPSSTAEATNRFVPSPTGSVTSDIVSETILTIGGQTITAMSAAGGIDIQQSTSTIHLVVGGIAATISSAIVSVNAGSQLEVAGSTSALPEVEGINQLMTLGSTVVTATPIAGQSGLAEVDGYTLSVGGPALTDSAEVISEAVGGAVAVTSTALAAPSKTGIVTTTSLGVSGSSARKVLPSSSTASVGQASRHWSRVCIIGVHLAALVACT